MGDCQVWATVDFGQGPVGVRCTVLGLHKRHRCEVDIGEGLGQAFLEMKESASRRNVFDKEQFESD